MRENNFDIVRLTLAWIVVLLHTYDLSLSPQLAFLSRILSPHLAVEGFFAISGFLIFASYERCASLREYFSNRAYRILPAYWFCTALCLVIAFCFGSFHVGRFLLANLTFLNYLAPGIPGVFDRTSENTAINGSLWTLKIEVMFYLAVPLIIWTCRRLHRDAVLWTLFVSSLVFRIALAGHEKLAIQLPGQLSYFIVGALIFYHLAWFKRRGVWVMLAAAALFALHAGTGLYAFRPASVAALTLGACLLLPPFKGPARFGDFSYGTYILHWPIIQLLVFAGAFRMHPWLALLLTAITVSAASAVSWFLVEKPSLSHSRSRRLRRAAMGEPNYPAAVP